MTKARIKTVMESKIEKPYEPTKRACRYWFEVLNREVFDGKLTPVDGIDIRQRRKMYAAYECIWKNEEIISRLLMSKKYRSKQFFLNILFHEMVHHYQALNDEPLGHGPSFHRWKDRAKKHGLELYVLYD